MVQQQEGSPSSEMRMLDRAREVSIPYAGGSEYQCPSCEAHIPTRKQIRLAKPAQHEERLNDILKCPFCNFLFSPKSKAHVIRG